MHDRCEVQNIFIQFQTHVERLLQKKIKIVQSDCWGWEYQKFHDQFFQSLGISHRVSCPHTHQQNSSAEHKPRHIVETGLALLAQASVPLKFLDESFLTATYLINWLPTHFIDNACPLECLFHTKPNTLCSKIFGCAYWLHLRPYNQHKVSFRSKPYVFLGYSAQHKGYKCVDRSTGRVYISRDVIFDEHIFPFANEPTIGLAAAPTIPEPMPIYLPTVIPSSNTNATTNHFLECATPIVAFTDNPGQSLLDPASVVSASGRCCRLLILLLQYMTWCCCLSRQHLILQVVFVTPSDPPTPSA